MRKAFALALILTVAAMVAYFTKPSDEKCMNAARQQVNLKLQSAAQALPLAVNRTLWQETMEKSMLENFKVEDRFLYKTIYMQKGSAKNNVGWAAFGKVQVELKD